MHKNEIRHIFLFILITSISFGCKPESRNTQKALSDAFFCIGTKQYSWEDRGHMDDYYRETRKVNVQVWYPGNKVDSGSIKTPYLLFSDKFYQRLEGWTDGDYGVVQKVETASFVGTPVKGDLNKTPLLIFSPSLGGNLSYYTYYAEYFATHGYIVMGINHLFESEAVVFNDVVYPAKHSFYDSLKSLKIPEEISAEKYREAMSARQKILAQDIQFSLNQLLEDPEIGRLIDTTKLAAFGHSIGGAAAIFSSILDKRIKAVINLDGTPPAIALNNGIDVPYLFIEDLTDYQNHEGYAIQYKRRNDFCKINRADSWRVLIKGFNHNSFLDVNYYLAENASEAHSEKASLDMIINYMDDFLDHYLLGSNELNLTPTRSENVEIIGFEKSEPGASE